MNKSIKAIVILFLFCEITFVSCKHHGDGNKQDKSIEKYGYNDDSCYIKGKAEEVKTVHLSQLKFNRLGIKLDTLTHRTLNVYITANGKLAIPPKHQAVVTSVVGGNVNAIKVSEGDKVRKGQILGYISHPDISKIQTEYIKAFNDMDFSKKEYERQKRLYEAKVGSGKNFQKAKSNYYSLRGLVKGYESQLRQLNIVPSEIRRGHIYDYVPVVSPIKGYIEHVNIRIGQYTASQTGLFSIVDNSHIHADLMVFEKDVYKVKKGQKINFTLEAVPESSLTGRIIRVGNKFEQKPKALHVHAEIYCKGKKLISGMYINGKILTDIRFVYALPEGAIIEEDGKSYIFIAKMIDEGGNMEWDMQLVEVATGLKSDGWVEINVLEHLEKDTKIVYNNAYYLISEMNKNNTSHSH